MYITGRRRQPLEIASGKLAPHVTAMQGDVVNTADLDRCFEEIRCQHGHLDVIFANAGAAEFVPLEGINDAHFDRIFQTNVKGLLLSVQKALPLMSKGGAIVLNGSVAASKGF